MRRGVVLFAHGSGSSRHSPRNQSVADVLNRAGLATLLFDLLTPAEALDRANVFDIDLLARRLLAGTRAAGSRPSPRRVSSRGRLLRGQHRRGGSVVGGSGVGSPHRCRGVEGRPSGSRRQPTGLGHRPDAADRGRRGPPGARAQLRCGGAAPLRARGRGGPGSGPPLRGAGRRSPARRRWRGTGSCAIWSARTRSDRPREHCAGARGPRRRSGRVR